MKKPHVFYIDVPIEFDYRFDRFVGDYLTGADVLAKDFGVKIKFICNPGGGISRGDAHSVEVENEQEEVFFLLKTGFTKLDKHVVKEYFATKFKQRKEVPWQQLRA